MERYFDNQTPSNGHLERFLNKFDEKFAGDSMSDTMEKPEQKRIMFRRTQRRHISFWRIIAFPAAGAAILVVLMNILSKTYSQSDYFHDDLTSEAVYLKYNRLVAEEVTKICHNTVILNESDAAEIMDVFSEIADDPVPFIEQLPDELSDELKTSYAKGYYSDKLQAIKKINNYKPLRK